MLGQERDFARRILPAQTSQPGSREPENPLAAELLDGDQVQI